MNVSVKPQTIADQMNKDPILTVDAFWRSSRRW
jgi:hypothetical protein